MTDKDCPFNKFTPLKLDPATVRSFCDRLAKLQADPKWPLTHWYNDEEFSQAFRTCLDLQREREDAIAAISTARHGASGMCCSLRLQEKRRAEDAERDRDTALKRLDTYRRAWKHTCKDLSDHQIGSDGKIWDEVALLEKQITAEEAEDRIEKKLPAK